MMSERLKDKLLYGSAIGLTLGLIGLMFLSVKGHQNKLDIREKFTIRADQYNNHNGHIEESDLVKACDELGIKYNIADPTFVSTDQLRSYLDSHPAKLSRFEESEDDGKYVILDKIQ